MHGQPCRPSHPSPPQPPSSPNRSITEPAALIRQSTIAASAIPCLRFLMAAATKKQPAAAAASTAAIVDPKFEWAEKAGTYVLRLSLTGFRKADFRVQVDGAGRLTVRGARPAAAGLASLHKVFQLPSAASLDDIAGRFEAGVLTLTVPKRASSSAPAPTTIEEVKRKQPSVTKEEEITEEDPLDKPVDEATCKAQEKKEEEAAKSRKQEQQKPAPAPMKQEEMVEPKATHQAAAVAPTQEPATKPEGASSSDKAKAVAAPDSLAERVRRRGEEERLAERVRRRGEEEHAKAAAAATAAMKAIAEQEKKATASCSGWKERVQAELKDLTNMKWAEGVTDMKWADGMVEAVRNNKEVAAVAVAAFSLGFLVSQKLFRK
uniref:Uncharacterized protein n=1 Tax=Avena sativa TaxID=4498 RepID=A0ACD5T6J8_AVESA